MTLASKWLDLVLGVDLHFELVPPVMAPVPFPHPFIGIIFDPIGYVVGEVVGAAISLVMGQPPSPSGPVLVNSMMASVTGDETNMPGGHFLLPPGTIWAPMPKIPVPLMGKRAPVPELPLPPAGDAMLLLGSQTVEFRGSKAVRVGEIAFSCSDPIRLPTSVVLPLLMSPNVVMVGGPPAVDWAQLLFMAGAKAGGALFKKAGSKLKGKIKASPRAKWVADKLHGAVDSVANAANKHTRIKPKNIRRATDFLHEKICHVTGHPVNIANGCMFTTWSDFELPGPIPLEFSRKYRSSFCDRDSPLGYGWSHSLDERLWLEPGSVVWLTGDGRELEFDTFHLPDHVMRQGDEIYDPVSRTTLRSRGQLRWELEDAGGLVREFGPVRGESPQDRDRGLTRLLRLRDRVGHEVTFQYDERARLVQVIDSARRRIILEYGSHGRLQHLWLPAADGNGARQHAHFVYDVHGDLVEAKDAAGKPVRFEYDQHLLVRETDRTGLSFYFVYEGWGPFARCVRTWGDGGILDHVLTYDVQNRRTVVTDSLGSSTVYSMNGLGAVTSIVDARGGETRFEFDDELKKVSETDPLGRTTRWFYDGRGNPLKIVSPDGATTLVRYDEHDAPTWLRTPKGGEWHWSYDAYGRVMSEMDPLGSCRRYHYEAGRLVAVEDPTGARTGIGYDSAENVSEVRFPDGTVTARRHDALGRVVLVVDPKGNQQQRTYDAQGQLVRVVEPDGNVRVIEYDAEGNVTRARDRLRDVAFTHTGMHQVASRSIGGTTVRLEYDTEQQLVAVVNEKGHTYRYERDPLGNVRAVLEWDGISREYVRDAAGQVTKVYRPGVRRFTTYRYDEAGRVIEVAHSDKGIETFAYDEDGALVKAVNATVEVALERDALGRIVRETQGEHVVESHYDHHGLRIGLRTSLGLQETIEHSVVGDVMRVTAKLGAQRWDASFGRDVLGQEVERLLPGGVRSLWWRDAVGRPTQHAVGKEGRRVRHRVYSWDVDDRLRELHDEGFGAQLFEHDGRGYLTKASHTDGRVELRLPDEVGNLFRSEAGTDREYGAAGEIRKRRTPEGDVTFRYDPEGFLKERQAPDGARWVYHWDGAGRLAKVERPGQEPVTFAYDALGRRIEKRVGEQRTWWVWDGDNPVHEGYREGGEPATTWLFEPESFRPMARLDEDGAYGIITDHLGTPLCLVDEEGASPWQARVDTWGNAEIVGDAGLCPWRFPGQYEDEETGLCYNRFRYYSAEIGGYVSRDPIGLAGGPNLYGYVDDVSVGGDPLGLAKSECRGGLFDEFGVVPGHNLKLDVPSSIMGDGRSYITYAFRNSKGKVVYVGRASGLGTPEQVLKARIAKGHEHFIKGLKEEVIDVQGTKLASQGAEEFFMQGFRQQGAKLTNLNEALSFDSPSRAQRSLLKLDAFFTDLFTR